MFTSAGESETTRLNYLLISSFEKIFVHELCQLKESPTENHFYFDKDCKMISIAIFQHIFDSN